jgi:hypothetical protein
VHVRAGRVICATIVWLLMSEMAFAACRDLRPVEGALGYGPRRPPERCEGMYQSLISSDALLQLLSFTRGRITFDPYADRMVTIAAPDVSALDANARAIAVVAQALPPKVYYRLDAIVKSGGSLQWPIGEVIIPARLSASDLGLLGIVPRGSVSFYVPLSVQPAQHQLTMIFRAPVDLETFQWKIIVGDVTPPSWSAFRDGQPVLAGDRIDFQLNHRSSGLATLDIAAKPKSQEYIRTRYQIFIP